MMRRWRSVAPQPGICRACGYMDIIWNLGDVERWNPNTPAQEYSRLEEPHLAINFRSIYDDEVHTCIMMVARFAVPGSPSGMMMRNWLHALCLAAPQA